MEIFCTYDIPPIEYYILANFRKLRYYYSK